MSDDRANQLIRDYKNGIITKDEAFGKLLPLVENTVYNALRYTFGWPLRPADAEDLFQDVIFAFYNSLDHTRTYDVGRNVHAYLRTIAINRKRDFMAENHGNLCVVTDDMQGSVRYAEIFDDQLIVSKLRDLHPAEVELLFLKQEEELTMEELAEQLSKPLSTIKYYIREAKKTLRDTLREVPNIGNEAQEEVA